MWNENRTQRSDRISAHTQREMMTRSAGAGEGETSCQQGRARIPECSFIAFGLLLHLFIHIVRCLIRQQREEEWRRRYW